MEIKEILEKKFPSLYEQELKDEIEAVGKIEEVPAGTVILDIGNYIKSVPLVAEGSVKVMREDAEGNEIFLYYIDVSKTCAMSLTCCLSYSQSKIRAIAEEDSLLILLPVNYVDEWMQKYSSWKNFVMMTYSDRFEELLRTIDLIAFQNMDKRLLKYLGDKARLLEKKMLHITHQEIANDLHSSREAVSRLLKQLEKMEKIKLYRNRIELISI